jgi:hypothetical protein
VGEQGAAAADAAGARARAIRGGDASPWIEHAVSLYRGGDTQGARDALALAMETLPDDPARWVDLGRLLGRIGWPEESATVLAKARPVCERQLARSPDDQAAAAALAELLPEADAPEGCTVLRPDVIASAAGATLTLLPDDSVLAGGANPPVDTYTIEATSGRFGITGLRLEVLVDPSLPNHGPGRNPENGNFVLDAIRLIVFPATGAAAPSRVRLVRVRAESPSQVEGGNLRAIGALDEARTTGWSVWPLLGRSYSAVFQTARPIGNRADTRFHVELEFRSPWLHHTIGRFRLSVTDRPFPLFEPSLARIKADGERDGRTRLGAAYALLGEWGRAAAVLERAVARPEATPLDGFLVAVARQHLGRRGEAHHDCDRAMARLRSERADEATHDVAIEALMTIRGLSVDEAEALVLDAAFPGDPFASHG